MATPRRVGFQADQSNGAGTLPPDNASVAQGSRLVARMATPAGTSSAAQANGRQRAVFAGATRSSPGRRLMHARRQLCQVMIPQARRRGSFFAWNLLLHVQQNLACGPAVTLGYPVVARFNWSRFSLFGLMGSINARGVGFQPTSRGRCGQDRRARLETAAPRSCWFRASHLKCGLEFHWRDVHRRLMKSAWFFVAALVANPVLFAGPGTLEFPARSRCPAGTASK